MSHGSGRSSAPREEHVPVRAHIEEGVIRIVADGVYGSQEFLQVVHASLEQEGRADPPLILCDVSRSASLESRTTGDLRRAARFYAEHLPPGRMAVVAGDDLAYGLMRMLGAFSEAEGAELRVFRDVRSAEEWLR